METLNYGSNRFYDTGPWSNVCKQGKKHHDVRQSASLTAWSAHYGQKLEQYKLKVFASDKYI
jgi:hypothetical protein